MVEDHAHGRINFVTRQPFYAQAHYGTINTQEQCTNIALSVHLAMANESNYKGTSMKWWKSDFRPTTLPIFIPRVDLKMFINKDDTFVAKSKDGMVQKDRFTFEK